jgi:excisionase family DNA binding protein
VSLKDAAELLGVHYMTAYRHVRTGRLPARMVDGHWRVRLADLQPRATEVATPGRARRTRRGADVERLAQRLVSGDEPGAWRVVEDALAGGVEPVDVHLRLLAGAMHLVGDRWAAGTLTVDEEHRATAVCQRLVGRLGPLMARRGRTRGSVVLAGVDGDPHALGVAIAADVVRAAGWSVVDLGASVPAPSLARAAVRADRLVAVGISASSAGHETALGEAVAAVRSATPGVPVLVGGGAVGADLAVALGADGWAADAAGLVDLLSAP